MSVFCLGLLRVLAEPAHGLIDELPELRPVDLAVAVYAEFDLLPRTAETADLDPRLGAVQRQLRHVVQRLEVQPPHELVAGERVAGRAEFHLQEPFLARDGVEEPAVGLLRRADLDHGPRVPVGFAEQLRLVLDAVDDVAQDAAFPAAGLAVAADAGHGMPVAAVDFPGHAGVLADFGDVAIALALGLGRGEVEELAGRVGTGREDRNQGLPGVGTKARRGEKGRQGEGDVSLSPFLRSSASPFLPFSLSPFLAFSA